MLPVGMPLEWPIVDGDGTLPFDCGAILIDVDEGRFLFNHFTPQRGDLAGASEPAANYNWRPVRVCIPSSSPNATHCRRPVSASWVRSR